MIQRQRPTPPHCQPCRCNRPPRLYQCGARFWMLECSPCKCRTAAYESVAAAVEAWGSNKTEAVAERVTPFRAALNAQRGRR